MHTVERHLTGISFCGLCVKIFQHKDHKGMHKVHRDKYKVPLYGIAKSGWSYQGMFSSTILGNYDAELYKHRQSEATGSARVRSGHCDALRFRTSWKNRNRSWSFFTTNDHEGISRQDGRTVTVAAFVFGENFQAKTFPVIL